MTRTDSDLGRLLLTERGMQFLFAHGGDPYAVLLRAEDEDNQEIVERIKQRGRIYRSRPGPWVVSASELAERVLTDPRLGTELPSSHVLADVEPFPATDWTAPVPTGGVPLDGFGPRFDLVRDVLRPAVAGLAAQALTVSGADLATYTRHVIAAGPAVDATLCAPRLADARAVIDACAGLRKLVPDSALSLSVLGVELTATLAAEAAHLLLADRVRWRALSTDPVAVGALLDGVLAEYPPMRLDRRVAREDLDLGGEAIAAGDEVVVHIGAAGIGLRGVPRIAAFTREVAATVLAAVAVRFPELRLDGAPVRRLRAPVTGALIRLPVADANSLAAH
ncbi:cytochrome P450 family protein [Nocardia callitridis]|uniref:Cytochrome P450 n=1 Tax=Nocardia callitridis TaxID=648753 RepID=A0ABP9K845_9NOCA